MYIFILFSTSLFQFIFTFKYTFVSPFLLLYIIIHTYLYIIITQYCIFRHTKRIHNKSRDSAIILVDNLPRSEIERLKRNTSTDIAIIDYDLNNDDNIPGEDFIYKIIKHHFVLNMFLAIFTSFSFPKLPNILEINNKSCLQFVKIRKLNFQNLKQTVLSNPYNTIHFFISKEVMQYKLYLNKEKYNKYTKYTDIIQPLVEFNNTSYSFNKVFF